MRVLRKERSKKLVQGDSPLNFRELRYRIMETVLLITHRSPNCLLKGFYRTGSGGIDIPILPNSVIRYVVN